MDEILSQEEIDKLIQAATAESNLYEAVETEEEDLPVRPYDFKRPHRLSKDQSRALQRIHETFAREFSGLISARLRTRVEITVNAIDQLSFGEFIRSIPNPSVINVYNVEPIDGSVIVQLAPDIVFLLYDRFCGGPGIPVQKARELTDIELAVLRSQFIGSIGSMLESAWSEAADLVFNLDFVESNPQFLQVMAERETIVLISLDIEINDVTDLINICFSHSSFELVLRQLAEQRLNERKSTMNPEDREKVRKKLVHAKVPIEVELGGSVLTISDLLHLEVGDVIPLETRVTDSLPIKVGDRIKFLGAPGRVGRRVATRIIGTAPFEGGQDVGE